MAFSSKERLTEILLHDEKIQIFENELMEILPELIVCKNCEQNLPAHYLPVLAHIYEVVNGVKKDITLKLSALFHDIGKPYVKQSVNGVDRFKGHEKASEILTGLILQRLGFEEDIKKDVCLLVKYHDFELFPTQESIDNITQKIGSRLVFPLLELQWSDLLAHSEQKISAQIVKRKAIMGFYSNSLGHPLSLSGSSGTNQ